MSQVGPPVASEKTVVLFTLGTAAIIGIAAYLEKIKNNNPKVVSNGYSIKGINYKNCNCQS